MCTERLAVFDISYRQVTTIFSVIFMMAEGLPHGGNDCF